MTATFSPTAARAYGVAAIVAPLLMLGSTLAFLGEKGINNGVVGGTIGVWSGFAFVVAFAGVYRMIEPRMPRVGPIFMVVTLIGFATGAAFNVQAMYLDAYGTDLLTDVTEGGVSGAPVLGAFAFLPWGWLVPVGLVATGVLLWRSRTAPVWSAALLAVYGVLFVIARPERIDALAVAADVLLLAAMLPIGVAMLRRPMVSEVMRTAPAE